MTADRADTKTRTNTISTHSIVSMSIATASAVAVNIIAKIKNKKNSTLLI
jgi:hypothetical protein